MPSFDIPAVVVGVDVNGLGVIRSLGRCGVPVIAMDTDLLKPTMRTRYARRIRIRSLSGPMLIEDLLALSQSLKTRPVLFLTQEQTVRTVSNRRRDIEDAYRILLPEHERLMALMHKGEFQSLAEGLGFPVPRAMVLTGPANLREAASYRFPCILKPMTKEVVTQCQELQRAYFLRSFEELEDVYGEIAPLKLDVILQEFIAGEDHDVYFCLQYRSRSGEAVISFVGRKLRSWPPQVGGTASCTAAPEMVDRLTAETSAFFDAVSFVGMGGIEYKKDLRTGQLLLVEPTVGRTDYQEEVATLHGLNIPFAAYLHELGYQVPREVPIRRKVIWRHTSSDREAAKVQTAERSHGTERLPVYDSYWRFYDPLPTLVLYANRVTRKIRRWMYRLRGQRAFH